MQEEEDEEDEGTAKFNDTARASSADEAGSAPQNRLSTMFDGWLRSSPAAPARSSAVFSPDNRKSIVSEPKLVPHFTGGGLGGLTEMDSSDDDSENFDEAAFEAMLVYNLSHPYAASHDFLRMISA